MTPAPPGSEDWTFRKKKHTSTSEDNAKTRTKGVEEEKSITDTQASISTIVDVKEEKDDILPPVSFLSLFRFSTPFERVVNILALVAAVAAGAAQPLMTLIFGRLTQSFVSFGAAIHQQLVNPSIAGEQFLQHAASEFRKDASNNALYLVFIGMPFLLPFVPSFPSRFFSSFYLECSCFSRYWDVRMYMVLHVHVGLDRRSKC